MEKSFSTPVYSSPKDEAPAAAGPGPGPGPATVIGNPVSEPTFSSPIAANNGQPPKINLLTCCQMLAMAIAIFAVYATVFLCMLRLTNRLTPMPKDPPFAVLTARASAVHSLSGNLVTSEDLDVIFFFQNPNDNEEHYYDNVNVLAFHGEDDDHPISNVAALQTSSFIKGTTAWIRLANVTLPLDEWVSDDNDNDNDNVDYRKLGVLYLRFELRGNMHRSRNGSIEIVPLQVVCRQVKVPFSYNTTREVDNHFNLHPCEALGSN